MNAICGKISEKKFWKRLTFKLSFIIYTIKFNLQILLKIKWQWRKSSVIVEVEVKHWDTMPGRPRRVPPPPPPGFGDDEYYRLYGQPEQYQKYRQVFTIILRISLEAPKIWIETVKQLLNFFNIMCPGETGHLA